MFFECNYKHRLDGTLYIEAADVEAATKIAHVILDPIKATFSVNQVQVVPADKYIHFSNVPEPETKEHIACRWKPAAVNMLSSQTFIFQLQGELIG